MLSVSHILRESMGYDGKSVKFMEEISRKTFNENKYLLEQSKRDIATITKLYDISVKDKPVLLRKKINIFQGIYREHYVYNQKFANSYFPKNGNGQFYFFGKSKGHELVDFMSGYFYNWDLKPFLKSFKIAERAGKQIFWELGGGSKYIFNKILKSLSKINI